MKLKKPTFPAYTAEHSLYRMGGYYHIGRTFSSAEATVNPALPPETQKSPTQMYEECVQSCEKKCIKDKGCEMMTPAAKATCKSGCNSKCATDCNKPSGGPPYGTYESPVWAKAMCLAGCWTWYQMCENSPMSWFIDCKEIYNEAKADC